MKRSLPIVLAVLLFAGGVRLITHRGAPLADTARAEAPVATVQPDPEAAPLIEIGVLEAEILAKIPSRNRGILAEVIEDGSRVETGDLLVRLDDEEIRNNIEAEVERLEQDRENLDKERHELLVLTNQYASVARLEKAELAHAELKLEKAEVPLTPREIRLHEIGIELAELDVEESGIELKRQRELVERDFAPPSSLGALERELEAANTFLEEKKTGFDMDRTPMPREERLTLESEVRMARETVRRSQKLHKQEVEIQNLKIEGLQLKIQHRRDKLDLLNEQLDAVRITAPTNGVFLLIRQYSWGARRWEPFSVGNRVWAWNLVGTIVDPDDLYVRVMVHESDVKRIRAGQKAALTLTAFPGRTLSATVRSITEMGQDRDDLSPLHRQAPPANQALFLALLDVEFPEDLPAMPGMTVTVRIPPGEKP